MPQATGSSAAIWRADESALPSLSQRFNWSRRAGLPRAAEPSRRRPPETRYRHTYSYGLPLASRSIRRDVEHSPRDAGAPLKRIVLYTLPFQHCIRLLPGGPALGESDRVIAVIDYDSGNLRSVHKALLAVGADARVIREPAALREARAVVLPGVGAFDDCINALRRQQLLAAVKEFIEGGRPFLGICVGYQALFEASEEYNSCAAGMGLFKGRVVRFSGINGLKVPQIGWNQVRIARPDCPLFAGIPDGSHFYFVHSFYPRPEDDTIVATQTDYGERFSSSVWRGNVFATQFHPEKSQTAGLQLLKNFVKLADGSSGAGR